MGIGNGPQSLIKCGPATARAPNVVDMKCVTDLDCDSIPPMGLVGLVELAPQDMLPGDIVCDLVRLSVLAILRRRDDEVYTWVEDAYVHGVIDKSAIRSVEAERVVLGKALIQVE